MHPNTPPSENRPPWLADLHSILDGLPAIFKFILDVVGGAIAFSILYWVSDCLSDLHDYEANRPNASPDKVYSLGAAHTFVFYLDLFLFVYFLIVRAITHLIGYTVEAWHIIKLRLGARA